ncbi:glycosyltransferase [Vibrio sp. Of7-15]|uniref:glycosyltransferase n=1 Tax=Vibrio sp. Of7-15 TaxID=2724879 RepID=UPI001EF1D26B|nr:glycosyltransferase [Vibrio sp. Of7-15]MCG7497432.1 glycosyltransferase [Vibrio sp. Of7-15]
MKYLIYTLFYYPETNGVTRNVDHRCRYLRELGHDVTLVFPDYPEWQSCPQAKVLQEVGVKLVNVPTSERTSEEESWFANHEGQDIIDNILRTECFDVFIVDEPMMLFMVSGFRLARLHHLPKKCKTVAICHGILSDLYRHYEMSISALQVDAIKQDIFDDYQLTAVPTRFVLDNYKLSNKAQWIPFLGVDKDYYSPATADQTSDAQQNVTQDKNEALVNVLFTGRLATEKNLPSLVEAAHHLHASGHHSIHWHFVGHGPLYSELKQQECHYLHVHGELHGDQLKKAYQTADIFVSACEFEAFGLTVAEAMACGLPVVTAHTGGNAEQYTHQVEGLNVDVSKDHELSNAILRLAQDQELRQTMGKRARQRSADSQESCHKLIDAIHRLGEKSALQDEAVS